MAFNLKSIGALLTKQFFDPPIPSGVTNVTYLNSISTQMDALFNISWQRRMRYNDFEKMDKGYMAAVLDTLATACTKYHERTVTDDILELGVGFKVEIDGYATSGPRAVIAQVLKDTQLKQKAFQYYRTFLKYGDLFTEILFQEDAVVGLQRYLTAQMYVNKDLKGRFFGPDVNGVPQAYQQKELQNGKVIAGFEPWQIAHCKFQTSDVHAYAEKGFLDDAREDWWKLSFEEEALVIARLTRAFPRSIHTLDMTGKSDQEQKKALQDYVRGLTRKQTRGGDMVPTSHSPDEDIFRTTQYMNAERDNPQPKLDKLEFYDPKMEGIANIGDIEYMRQKLFLRTPSDIVGIVARSPEITAQDIAYGDLLISSQDRFEAFVRQILDTALAIKGYSNVPYRVTCPLPEVRSTWKNADAQYRIALTDQVYEETGTWSRADVLRNQGKTDAQIAQSQAEIKAENMVLPPLTPQSASQRGAGAAQV